MTGPEHFKHAEQLLDWASAGELDSNIERYHLAAAQVHATLAVAAATALMSDVPIVDWRAWYKAAGTPRPPPPPGPREPDWDEL